MGLPEADPASDNAPYGTQVGDRARALARREAGQGPCRRICGPHRKAGAPDCVTVSFAQSYTN
jgi:hypothetical protein